MSDSVTGVVMCERCRKHAAEIVSKNGRKLCGECHLDETGTHRPPRGEGEPEE
jgi:hypothetical protein